jgi:chemotaxis protein methyltransferase CheR
MSDVFSIEVRLVLEAIYARYGYDFRDYTPESISRRLQTALTKSGAAHFGEFQHRLLTEPAFFASVIDDLTVQVSAMFRDPNFYRTFREHVIPTLRTYPQIKIWHAGCATGEEVYTMAILLHEENLYDRAQIYATDVSSRAIEQAREGVYSESEAASFEANYVQSGGRGQFTDHCSSAYGCIAIKETLRKNVVFFQHDLVTDHALGEMHVVFCRNVLIYFGETLRERVFDLITGCLFRGGFVCLGNSERVPSSRAEHFEAIGPVERIYRKRMMS